jgi:oligogalacturonide lyase
MKSHGVSGRWWWVGLLVAGALRATEPPLSWIDPDTGHRVIRLTREPGSASLYFNDNGYTPDGRAMVYTTPEGISVLDLQTGQTRPLVHGRVRVVVVGRKTPTVFYVDPADRQLHAADIGTGRSRAIAPLPPGGAIGTINADETLAAGTYPEGAASGFEPRDFAGRPEAQNHPLEQPANKGQMMERRLAARRRASPWPYLRSTCGPGPCGRSFMGPTGTGICNFRRPIRRS